MRLLKQLEATQWWPRERLMSLQDERLRALVQGACENVPYYRDLFRERGLQPEDIKGSRDLAKLPVLTRRLVKDNLRRLVDRGMLERTGQRRGTRYRLGATEPARSARGVVHAEENEG